MHTACTPEAVVECSGEMLCMPGPQTIGKWVGHCSEAANWVPVRECPHQPRKCSKNALPKINWHTTGQELKWCLVSPFPSAGLAILLKVAITVYCGYNFMWQARLWLPSCFPGKEFAEWESRWARGLGRHLWNVANLLSNMLSETSLRFCQYHTAQYSVATVHN